MKEEDLRKLVMFESGDVTLMFSKIENIKPGILKYSGETFQVDEDLLEEIKEGLVAYEVYKLSMTRSDAEETIQDKSDEIIEETFRERFKSIEDSFQETINSLTATIDYQASNFKHQATVLQTITTDTVAIVTSISDAAKLINPDSINAKVHKKLDELETVKTQVLDATAPIIAQSTDLLTSLSKLVLPPKK